MVLWTGCQAGAGRPPGGPVVSGVDGCRLEGEKADLERYAAGNDVLHDQQPGHPFRRVAKKRVATNLANAGREYMATTLKRYSEFEPRPLH